MNLNLAEVKSINHHPPSQKDSSNINDALRNLSIDINQNSVKNKNNCSIDINSKILDNYLHKLDVNNDKSQHITSQKAVHKFIDNLVEGLETSLTQSNHNLNISLALKQEYECHYSPPIELHTFAGNLSEWPEFISNFQNRIQKQVSFNDSMRMERLVSALEGEAKKSVESIGCEGIFCATVLKSLKQDFGNPVLVSHLKIKSIFDQPQIKPSDKIGLRKYHHQIKIINTWLLSMGYEDLILSYENLSKAVTHLPTNFEHSFSKPLKIVILQMVPLIY